MSSPVGSDLPKIHPRVNVATRSQQVSQFLTGAGGLHRLLQSIMADPKFEYDGKIPLLYAIGKFKSPEPFYKWHSVERVAALKARVGGFYDYQDKVVEISPEEILSHFDIFLKFANWQ